MDLNAKWKKDPDATRDELLADVERMRAEGEITKSKAAIAKIGIYRRHKEETKGRP